MLKCKKTKNISMSNSWFELSVVKMSLSYLLKPVVVQSFPERPVILDLFFNSHFYQKIGKSFLLINYSSIF